MRKTVLALLAPIAVVACTSETASPRAPSAHVDYGDATHTLTVDAAGDVDAIDATLTFHYATSAGADQAVSFDLDAFARGEEDAKVDAFTHALDPAFLGDVKKQVEAQPDSILRDAEFAVLARGAAKAAQGGEHPLATNIGGAPPGDPHQCYLDCMQTGGYTSWFCFRFCYGISNLY